MALRFGQKLYLGLSYRHQPSARFGTFLSLDIVTLTLHLVFMLIIEVEITYSYPICLFFLGMKISEIYKFF